MVSALLSTSLGFTTSAGSVMSRSTQRSKVDCASPLS